jgi:VWFA-related protein
MTPQKFFACVARAVLLCGTFVSSQTVSSQSVDVQSATNLRSESVPTFHSTSRLVIVNVVVTDRDGKPITGLARSDFTLTEDGKPQQLQVFEPHVPVQQPPVLPAIKLPPDEYSNFPTQVENSAVNVVWFDVLNSPTTDQMFARLQMIEFLKLFLAANV